MNVHQFKRCSVGSSSAVFLLPVAIALICVLTIVSGTKASAQHADTLLVTTRTSVFGVGGTLHAPIALDDSGLIVAFLLKRGLCTFNIRDISAEWIPTTPSLALMDYFYPAATDGGVVARLRSDELGYCVEVYSKTSVEVKTPNEIVSTSGFRQNYTPLLGRPDSRLSLDLGQTFFTIEPEQVGNVVERETTLGDSTLMFESLTNRRKYVWLASSSPRLVVTPFTLNSSSTTRMSARSAPLTIYTIVRPDLNSRLWHLATGLLGDTTLSVIDTLLVDGTKRGLRPQIVSNMWADSVFYVDSAGWQCIVTPTGSYPVDCPISVDEVRAEREWLYVFSYGADSTRVAFTSRSQYPKWTTWSVHSDFRRQRHEYHPLAVALFGPHGFSMSRANHYSTISSPLYPYPVAVGAMLSSLNNLQQQRILGTWVDSSGLPMALDDYGRVLRREVTHPNKPTYVTYPGLLFDERTSVNMFIDDPDGTLPWFGVRTPTSWQIGGNDTLVHCGSIVRRLLSRGDVQDTVWRGLTTAFARVDSTKWCVANHDALWVRTGADTTRYDVSSVRSASGLLPGYPSSITPLNSGTRFLVSFYGTMRADSDLVPQPYRQGGLAMVDGKGEPIVVPLPAECGSYVYPVHRQADGTLLALTAQMREDSSMSGRQTPILTNVRYIRSTDQGATWTSSATLFYTGPWLPCTGKIIDLGGGYLLGVMPSTIVVSTDGGRTWNFDNLVPASMRAIDIQRSGNELLVAAHDGLYRLNTITSVDREQAPLRVRPDPVSMKRDAFRAHVSTLESATVYDLGGRVLCTSQDCESVDTMPLHLGSVVMVVSATERRLYHVE